MPISNSNRERILKQIREAGSYRGGSQARAGLFIRPSKGEPLECYILPDLQKRGTEGLMVPYLSITSHWVDRQEQGRDFRSGITCLRRLAIDEPTLYEFGVGKKLIDPKVDQDCLFCLLLDQVDPEKLPADKFQRPMISPRTTYNFQALKPEEDYEAGDDQLVKVLPATVTGMRAFMEQVYGSETRTKQFEAGGVASTWHSIGQAWQVTLEPTPRKPWLSEWKSQLVQLELKVPVWFPLERQAEVLIQNLPQYRKEITSLAGGKSVPKRVEKGEKAKPSRPEAKTRVKRAS